MPSTWPRLYPDPSRAVAQEILLRHQPESSPPAIVRWLDKIIPALKRLANGIPPRPEPPRPFADVMAPLNRGPLPRAGAVALREPD